LKYASALRGSIFQRLLYSRDRFTVGQPFQGYPEIVARPCVLWSNSIAFSNPQPPAAVSPFFTSS